MALDNGPAGRRTDEMTGYYKVADFVFAVTLRRDWELDVLLPSFIPFRCGKTPDEELLFIFLEDDVAEERAHLQIHGFEIC